jgi:hypothetical protein
MSKLQNNQSVSWLICPTGKCKKMPRKLPRRPWASKEWKKKREEILLIKSACEWCGSRIRLQIAHKSRNYSKYQSDKKYEDYLEMKMEEIRVLCSSCHLAHHKQLDLCPICHGWKKEYYEKCFKCKIKKNSDEYNKCPYCKKMKLKSFDTCYDCRFNYDDSEFEENEEYNKQLTERRKSNE